MPSRNESPLETLLFSIAGVAIDEDSQMETRRIALSILYRYLASVLLTPEEKSADPSLDRIDKIIEEKKQAVS
jgi:thiamine kinase-like enzyme